MNSTKRYYWVVLLCSTLLSCLPNKEATLSTQHEISTYHFKSKDTWPLIAARFRLPLVEIWRMNGITNPEAITPDTPIMLPLSSLQAQDEETSRTISINNLSALHLAVTTRQSQYTILSMNGISSPFFPPGLPLVAPHNADFQYSITIPLSPPPTGISSNTPESLVAANMGVQGQFILDATEIDYWLALAQQAGFMWIKQQVNWGYFEPLPDSYPYIALLDNFVDKAAEHKLNVLLSVVKAPGWIRHSTNGDGPPYDNSAYFNFTKFLATRYQRNLDKISIAFEIWNEPNTVAEWSGAEISASDYITLLGGSYVTLKEVDQRYLIISAGLAPVSQTVNQQHFEDRQYLQAMYDAGLARVVDGVGVHPYGWSNAPDAHCCGNPDTMPAFDETRSFYFLDTIQDYRAIQLQNNDDHHPLWVTEFGWASLENISENAPTGYEFIDDLDEKTQAQYIVSAYLIAQQLDYVGPMFLWNLNLSTIPTSSIDFSSFSLFLPSGAARQAYLILSNTDKK